jgi:hypothetical protein
MKTKQPYTPVKLSYDGRKVQPGEFLRTPAGSVYMIQAVTPSPSRPQRRYLSCLRWPADEIPEGATVHPLYWYARTKKSGRTLSQIEEIRNV